MNSYNGDHQLKADMLVEVEKHRASDMLIKGTYGSTDEKGKWRGCAVGCSLHSLNKIRGFTASTADHSAYETSIGVPISLAYLQDGLFERLSDKDAQEWPTRFWRAVPVGVDLRFVYGKWFAWTLLDDEIGFWKVWKNKEEQDAFKAFGEFVAYLAEDKPFVKCEWDAARNPFLDSLARLDSLASLARLARLDSLGRLARLDSLGRLGGLARLDSLGRLGIFKIAADKLIRLLENEGGSK